jgi:glycosyltransferase involved in cell wall biosynthesis
MRLGLDLLYLIPRETGGRETYARELIGAMLELEPSLEATAFVNREATPELLQSFGSSVALVTLPVSGRSAAQWAIGELALLPRAAARGRIEVLHSLANFGPATGRFARVLTIHDLQYRAMPELLTRARRAGTAAMMRAAAKRASRVIAVSNFTAGELIGPLGLPADKIDVIPNGIAGPTADPVGETVLRERQRLGDRPVVLSVATALPHKNLGELLAAIALIPPDRRPALVLVGAGTDGRELAARAETAGVTGDVRLLGYQPPEVLEGLYRLAACIVMPTLYEGFGLPVLEAMVRGVAVACSEIPTLRELAGDAALYFKPRAPEIAAVIRRLVGDSMLRARLGEAGRVRAERYSWQRAAEATLGSYRRALDRGPSRLVRASA